MGIKKFDRVKSFEDVEKFIQDLRDNFSLQDLRGGDVRDSVPTEESMDKTKMALVDDGSSDPELYYRGRNGSVYSIGGVGPTGPQGPTGATGATGPQGPAGANGVDGADGADGAPGPNTISTADDYEEGTWTGAFVCGTSGTATIDNSYKTGRYTKIGRIVHLTGQFLVNSVSSPVGRLSISGIPFTAASGNESASSVSVRSAGLEATAATQITGFVGAGGTTVVLDKFSAGAVANLAADCKANSNFIIDVIYSV